MCPLDPQSLPEPQSPPAADPAPPTGRVARVDRTSYDVHTSAGTIRVPALPPPDNPREAVTVGDRLLLPADGPPVRLPRTSLLARGTAGGRSTVQPLAANVDTVLVCAGLSGVLPVRRLERLVLLAWDSGATPVLVLTKADLCDDVERERRLAQRHAPGVDVAVVSAERGELADLDPYVLAGATLVLLGASGAGKSTLLNALAGGEVMATQQVRDADGKGRHTTTHRELVVLPSGAVVIDTPGLRGVALQGGAEALDRAFEDVDQLASACRFADCGHAGEPGCAVQASVEAGDLPGERVESWRRLQRELAFQTRRSDARQRAQDLQRWKVRARAQRQRGGRP